MNPASYLILALQQSGDENQREFYRQYSALMLILILLSIIVITALAFIVTRRRARRRMEDLPKRKDAPIADAWTESGKRMDESIMEFRDD
jgi:flagellar biosynthesis/type III secretory pathway M-ring protein FliF/YscJ